MQYYTSTTPLGSANTAGVSTKGVNTSNLDCYEEAAAFDLEGGCGTRTNLHEDWIQCGMLSYNSINIYSVMIFYYFISPENNRHEPG